MGNKNPAKPLTVQDPGIAVAQSTYQVRKIPYYNPKDIKSPINVYEATGTKEIEPQHPAQRVGKIEVPTSSYQIKGESVDYASYAKEAYSQAMQAAQKEHYDNVSRNSVMSGDYPKNKNHYPDYPNMKKDDYVVFFRGEPIYQGATQLKVLNHMVFSTKELDQLTASAEKFGIDPSIMIAQRQLESAGRRTTMGKSHASTWDVEKYMGKKYGLEEDLVSYFRSAGKPYVYVAGANGEITENEDAARYHIIMANRNIQDFRKELMSLTNEADRHAWYLKNVGLDNYNRGTDKQFGFNYADRVRYAAEMVRNTDGYKRYYGNKGKPEAEKIANLETN